MTDPIRAALKKAAEAVLFDLKDRKGVGNEIEQCDDDIQAEIGRTVAAKAIHTFLRALPDVSMIVAMARSSSPNNRWQDAMAQIVLAAAKEEPSSDT
jgi:hypothetical protein